MTDRLPEHILTDTRDASGGLTVDTNIKRAIALTNYLHRLEAEGKEIPKIVDKFWFDLTQAIRKYNEAHKDGE